METILVQTENKSDLKLLKDLLQRLNLRSKVLTEDEKEEMVLAKLMREADRNETVSEKAILALLK